MIEQFMITNRRTLIGGLAVAAAASTVAIGPAAAAGSKPFRGLFPIGSTPVDANDKIDFDGLANQVAFLRRGRVPGLAWPQIASGWSVLSEAERLQGAEVLVAAARGGGTAIVIGVQSPDLAAVHRYAKHAEKIGADAIICIPPAAITDENALFEYYKEVGGITPLPLFMQTIGKMSVDLLVRVYEAVPTMRYIKDESGEPTERVADLIKRTDGKINDFAGRGGRTMLTEMERGFVGSCPYVGLADVYQASWEAWHSGNHQKAFEIFGAIEAVETMFDQGSVELLIARKVFKPGTTLRRAPPAPGAVPRNTYMPATSPEAISRVIADYLQPYIRA